MKLTINQIKEKKNIKKPIVYLGIDDEVRMKLHRKNYSIKDYTTGKFILYEVLYKGIITYPKLAIIINTYVIDMAIEIEYIDVRRTWEHKTVFEYQHNGEIYEAYASENKSLLKTTIIWNDEFFVYGTWDSKPKFKDLKEAYKKTLWFNKTTQEQRDLTLNNLLRNV